METYLPLIKNTLTQLFQFTLDNSLYVGIIAALAWLLTAVFYSIRIAFLKRINRKSQQARAATQNALEALQQQFQQIQEELAQAAGQIEQEKSLAQQQQQRLTLAEGLIIQRNKQQADLVQVLATQLDLGERPIPVSEDIKAEEVWQQHSRVIKQLIDRLQSEQQSKIELQQTCQAETAKLVEKDLLLTTLRTTLDIQNSQLANMEQALAEQKSLLQQQQGKTQQVLADLTEKYRAELTNASASQSFEVEPVITAQDVTNLATDSLEKELSLPSFQPENNAAEVVNETIQALEPNFEGVINRTVSSSASATAADSFSFVSAMAPEPSQPETKPSAEPIQALEPEPENIPFDYPEDIIMPAPQKPAEKQTVGVTGKLKGLFTKKQAADKKPVEQIVSKEKAAGTKKLTGWLGKVTSKKDK